MSSRIVWKVSAAIWCFSFAMAFLPIHLGWNTPDGAVQNSLAPTSCSLGLNRPYVLVVALGTYFAPLLVVCGVYVRVLQITRRQVREINSATRASNASLPPSATAGGVEMGLGFGRAIGCCGGKISKARSSSLARLHIKPRPSQDVQQQKRHRIVSDRKATVNLASVVLAFAICWIPYFVLFTAKPFLPASLTIPSQLDLACLWLGYINSSINPFLYAFYNSTFRDGFRRLLCRGCLAEKGFGSRASGRLSRRSVESSWRESPGGMTRGSGVLAEAGGRRGEEGDGGGWRG